MPLSSGTRLGGYEITHVLGAGGMGEVYRARDSKLGRNVAIKVILDSVRDDTDRVARFEREAKVLAAINHPNIAALYGMEEWNGQHFLIMELVEGETLSERLQRGPLPVEDALRVALQTAEALEAAHERNIIHRDLKPANIKITPDDKVKVLDFGLAKTMEAEPARDVANSPTLSMMATNAGIILGTAAYMSPEQAKGFAADHRSDVFSFGVVLYEMLTGRQPFQGETAPDVLASVLVREPELQRLPGDLNPRIAELLRRCLEKNPKRRWQAIGDLRAEVEALMSSPRASAPAAATIAPLKPMWRRVAPLAVASVIGAVLGAAAVWQPNAPPTREIIRFAIPLPIDQGLTGVGTRVFDISADGQHVAFTAGGMIYIRPISSLTATAISDTQTSRNAFGPTFSPDGQHVAFFTADGFLKRAPIQGGAATTVCQVAPGTFSLTWVGDDIFFSSPGAFMRVPAAGGTPAKIEIGSNDHVQRAEILPDGDTLLLSLVAPGDSVERWAGAHVVTRSLRTGASRLLVKGASDGRYVATGHLLYMMAGTLHAVAFDASRLETSGAPVPVIEGVRRAALTNTGLAWFSLSSTGTLIYMPGPASPSTSVYDVGIVERNGTITAVKLPPAPYRHPRVSRDGERLAVETDDGNEAAVRVYHFARGGPPQRITFAGKNRFPIWAPDGRRVAFQSDRQGDAGIYWQAADGSSDAERLTTATAGERHIPESWHPSGDVLLFSVAKGTEYTLWTYSVRDKQTAPFGGVRSDIPTDGIFSPDGKWVAYSSRGSVQGTIYVQPFPATGAKYELSRTESGVPHHPLWISGTTLVLNQRPGTLDSIAVATSPSFAFGKLTTGPRRFMTGPPSMRRTFDALPDGRLVGLINQGDADSPNALQQFTVVLNWFNELKAKVTVR